MLAAVYYYPNVFACLFRLAWNGEWSPLECFSDGRGTHEAV